jgi:hypothetical protein
MNKTVVKFNSFADAQRADRRYYLSLTPQQRLDILLELVARHRDTHDNAAEGLARVCRVVKRPRR